MHKKTICAALDTQEKKSYTINGDAHLEIQKQFIMRQMTEVNKKKKDISH